MSDNEREIDIDGIYDSAAKRVADLLSSNRDDSQTNVDIYNKIYGNKKIDDASKKNKISALRRGKISKSMDELIRIAHAMDVSLDWLVFGKEEKSKSEKSTFEEPQTDKESTPYTVRSFFKTLMYLSLAEYISDYKIEARGRDFFYHDINISFSIEPLSKIEGDHSVPWQCDTVTHLTRGLIELSKYGLLNLPNNNGKNYLAKVSACKGILSNIPYEQGLTTYQKGCTLYGPYFCKYVCSDTSILENYDTEDTKKH